MKLSECYLSVQGEGPRVGIPTVFVRFGGCNLRCPGWPCDTPHAIFPERYRHEWKIGGTDQTLAIIEAMADGRLVNVCYTGGEPFLQPNKELERLTWMLHGRDWVGTVECFSNGTLPYPSWVHGLDSSICFIMDWKLPGSGEDPYDVVRTENLRHLRSKDAIKFVLKNKEDFGIALALYKEYAEDIVPRLQVFYGVAWGHLDLSDAISWVLEYKLPWRLNVQTHNYVWPPHERGR